MHQTEYHPFKTAEAKIEYLAKYNEMAGEWPAVAESRMVKTSYGKTFVRVSGPTDALPFVLLPGMGVTSLMWIPNVKDWSEKYRIYAIDNIYDAGLGIYSRPINKPVEIISWLDELFVNLGLNNNINLLGVSYGGWLSALYSIRHPDRLRKVIIISPAATVSRMNLSFQIRIMLGLFRSKYHISFLNWFLSNAINSDEAKTRLDKAIELMILARACFKVKNFIVPTVLTDKELAGIVTPCLLLIGENEKMYSAQKAINRINSVAPKIITQLITGAGHDLTLTKTELVNSRVLKFLENNKGVCI